MTFNKKPLIAAALLVLASTTQAQSNTDLQPITVYGSRFQETIEKALPQTTIITSTEIEKSGLTNVSEILQKIGNLPVKTDLRGGNNVSIDLRGYGDAADNNVVVLLDGVRLSEDEGAPARISMIPVEVIDHIEVQRGGSSVLYGNGATSGFINIITKKYVKDQTVLTGGIGSFNSLNSSIYTSKKINDVNFSLFGKTNNTDNYRDNNKNNERTAGSVINWSPSDRTSAGIRVFANEEKSQQPGALPSIYLNTNPKQTQVPGYKSDFEINSSNITLFGSHKVDDVEFSADLSTRKKETNWDYNYDASTVSSAYYYAPYTTAYGKTNSESTTKAFSPRVKVNQFFTKNNSLIIGYDWSKSILDSSGLKNNTDYSYEENVAFTKKSASTKSEALYFYDDWKITESDRLIIGGRRQRFDQTGKTIYGATPSYVSSYVYNGVTYSSPSDGSYGHEMRQYLNAYEIQYSKKLSHNFETYLKQGNSFRLPTADDNGFTSTGNPLRPQTSHDQEIGLKWLNSENLARLSLFKSELTDEIVFSGSNKNEVPTIKKGVDASLIHKYSSMFSARINLQIVNAEISQGINAGKKTPGVAQRTGGVGLETKLKNNHMFDMAIRGASSKFASEDTGNTQAKTAGYMVGDLSYIIKEASWTWVARMNNVLDKQYADYSIYKSTSYDYPFQMSLYPNPGRNISLTGRYVF
jgi:iron complex outermembrane receptor protein